MPVSSGLGAKTLNKSYERSMPEKEGQFSHWREGMLDLSRRDGKQADARDR